MKHTKLLSVISISTSLFLFSSCSTVDYSDTKLSTVTLKKSYTVSGPVNHSQRGTILSTLVSSIASEDATVTIPAGTYNLIKNESLENSAMYQSTTSVNVTKSKGPISYLGGFLAAPGVNTPHAVYYKKRASAGTSAANLLLLGETTISKQGISVSALKGELSDISTNQ